MKVYQVQFKDRHGDWKAFNAHHQYDILFDLKDAQTLYDQMIEYHKDMMGVEGHRIVCWEVSEVEVLKEE